MKKLCLTLFCLSLAACSNEVNSIDPSLLQNNSSVISSASKATNDTDSLVKQIVDKKFKFADKNKDNSLNTTEFRTLESEHDDVMLKLFKKTDTNKDGKVSYEEFSKPYTESIKSSTDMIFSSMDNLGNKNSFIDTAEEFENVIYVAKGEDSKISDADVKKEFLKYDANKDKKLSFEEFEYPMLSFLLKANPDPYAHNSIKNSTKTNKNNYLPKLK